MVLLAWPILALFLDKIQVSRRLLERFRQLRFVFSRRKDCLRNKRGEVDVTTRKFRRVIGGTGSERYNDHFPRDRRFDSYYRCRR